MEAQSSVPSAAALEAKRINRARLRRVLRRLRRPGLRWVRIPAGALLLVAGVLGFLPVIGFWMAPLGLLILAIDFAPVRHWFRGARRRIRGFLSRA